MTAPLICVGGASGGRTFRPPRAVPGTWVNVPVPPTAPLRFSALSADDVTITHDTYVVEELAIERYQAVLYLRHAQLSSTYAAHRLMDILVGTTTSHLRGSHQPPGPEQPSVTRDWPQRPPNDRDADGHDSLPSFVLGVAVGFIVGVSIAATLTRALMLS